MSVIEVSTAIVVVLCATLGMILKLTLFTSVPSSEPLPDFDNFEFENLASAYEDGYEPSWKFPRSSFLVDEIVRMIIRVLFFSLFSIPISLVCARYAGERHSETGTDQESSEIRMLLQEGERLRQELKTMVALGKQAEGHRQAQFPKEIEALRSMIREERKQRAEFKNEMDSMRVLMKIRAGRHVQFLNAMDAAKNMIKMERKRCTNFWDDINSMTSVLDVPLSTSRQPASRELKSRAPKASVSAAKRVKRPRGYTR
jgi:hypothetical protein